MCKLDIISEEECFSCLSPVFSGEFESDACLSAEILIVGREETDVLSFPTLDGIRGKKIAKSDFPYDVSDDGSRFIGSVVICREVAEEQAREYGHSFERELYYLAVHGLCHLLGYDHMTDDDKAEMRRKEERIMERLNLKRDNV